MESRTTAASFLIAGDFVRLAEDAVAPGRAAGRRVVHSNCKVRSRGTVNERNVGFKRYE